MEALARHMRHLNSNNLPDRLPPEAYDECAAWALVLADLQMFQKVPSSACAVSESCRACSCQGCSFATSTCNMSRPTWRWSMPATLELSCLQDSGAFVSPH